MSVVFSELYWTDSNMIPPSNAINTSNLPYPQCSQKPFWLFQFFCCLPKFQLVVYLSHISLVRYIDIFPLVKFSSLVHSFVIICIIFSTTKRNEEAFLQVRLTCQFCFSATLRDEYCCRGIWGQSLHRHFPACGCCFRVCLSTNGEVHSFCTCSPTRLTVVNELIFFISSIAMI